MRSPKRFLPFLTLAAVLYGLPAYAQAPNGAITGVVRDPGGAAVADADVTATNAATGASRSAVTGPDGAFVIAELAPGSYTVSASLVGFRRATVEGVQVAGEARVVVDLVLRSLVLEGITVTATLREQELADVPFSIAAPTADELRSRGADDLEDVAANVAGFSVQNLGPGQSQIAMRGASAGQIARDQPGVKEQVGVYLDDAVVSLSLYTPDLDLFDLSRVEILRGPQGTLFGSGSMAGTVRYITNQPELGVTSYFGEAGVSQVDGGGTGGDIKAGFNVPLGDRAAARVVAYRTEYGGFMDAVQPVFANDTISGFTSDDDVNTGDRTGVRAALKIVPEERLSITPRVVYQRLDMDGWNRIDDFNILANPFTTTNPAVTLDERELSIQIDEPTTDDFLLTDLNLKYDFGAVSLTSITSYMYRDIIVVRDAGALTSSITGGSLGLSEPIYTLDSPLDDATTSKVFTQELRLAGGEGDRITWLLGGFFSSNERDYGQSLLVSGFDGPAAEELGAPPGFTRGLVAAQDELFFSDLSYDLTQFAAFGEATVAATDRLNITGGLRFYSFDEDREQIFDGIFANDDTGIALVSVPGDTDADGLAPRIIAAFDVSDEVMLNAQASRGFRLGGINDPLNEPLCTDQDLATFRGRDSWEDETVWNYEVGAKTRFLDGRVSFNASAFYMDISDLQLIVTAGSCSSRLVFNVPEARSAGFEVEFGATPDEHFDFAVSASLTDSELRSTLTTTDEEGQVSVVAGIESGNRLPSVPRFKAAGAATYRWELQDGWPVFVTGSYQHVGSRITQIDDHAEGVGTVAMTSFEADDGATIGGPLTQITFTFDPVLPAYNLLNARIGVIRGSWEIALYGNNLTDERAFLALDRERGTLARVGYLTNQSRTFGLSLRFNY
jgi:iron complex outermembrane receptor protein